jgi:hypothetical protein
MLFLIGRKDKGAESSSDRFELEGGMKVSTYAYSGFNRQHPYASARAQTGKGHYKFDFRHFFKQDFNNCSWLTDNEPGFANYLLNDTMLTGKMLYNRFGIEMRYKRISYEFKNPYKFTNNYQDNGLILSGMYRAAEMKKTAFISEFYYGKIEYTKSQFTDVNYSYYYVWLGIKGRFTKKITGLLKAGFEANNYVSKKDTTNFPVMISLNYKFSPKTTFLLGAKESGLSSANTAAGNYTGSYVTLHCLHSFTKKIGVDLGANCYIQKWHEPKRQDKGHGFSAVLEYKQNKQSRFYAEYLYSLKNSGAAHNAGFIDTRVSLRAEIIF